MMGGWLARLKNEKAPDPHAREPRQPSQENKAAGFLGLQAYPPAPFQKIGVVDSVTVKPAPTAANDAPAPATEPAADPDRWCWPHSTAMNTGEIGTFTARLARFTARGVSYDEAERLADVLVIRDHEGDDRRLCLECAHLQGVGRWRCGNWKLADAARDGLARDLVKMLQRCPGFTLAAGAHAELN
jgi:hypothetical protein